MGLKVFLCVMFLSLFLSPLSIAEDVVLKVRIVTPIATTDENFVCATLDWWPTEKCDYNQCPWGLAGILTLDLKHPILVNAIKAFKPLRLRIGGSLQDQVVYNVGKATKCPHFKKRGHGLFGFSKGCLQMEKWDELNNLFNKTGAIITFGLNALYGKKPSSPSDTLWVGDWNTQNAGDLMHYTKSKGYKIESYELGNELCSTGVAARLTSKQYAKDFIALKAIVEDVFPDASTRPSILGPAGFYSKQWFDEFLQYTGPNVVKGLTHHIYNLGAGKDPELISKIQDPYFLDHVARTYEDISTSIKEYGPWADAWVGEAGGAYNSGGKDVSHTFVNGFWYLDQLGMTSTFNHKVFCRQSLIGGNYGLLNTTSFMPNPDYYGALLWHRVMGRTVLGVSHEGSPYLRAYSHCAKQGKGIAMLLINMSNSTSFNISVVSDMNLFPSAYVLESNGDSQRDEYHLTPENGDIQSDRLLLNGKKLLVTESQDIPELKPLLVDPAAPIWVAPDSIVFVRIKNIDAPACAK